MFNIFEGLESLGFSEVKSTDIYKKEEDSSKSNTNASGKKVLAPEDIVYYRNCECPVCASSFQSQAVKQRGTKYTHSDTDLRMYYEPLDPLYYDIILCTKCGYAATTKQFKKISTAQKELISVNVSRKFKPVEYPLILNVDQAIERYKIALLNTVSKNGKDGEKAYLCLKLAWLYRDKKDEATEKEFIKNSLVGFAEAYQKESFPICGLEEHTLMYIMADLSRRVGNNDACLRYLGRLLTDRTVHARLKDKALVLKDMVKSGEANKAKEATDKKKA